jgi:hypothetical protein
MIEPLGQQRHGPGRPIGMGKVFHPGFKILRWLFPSAAIHRQRRLACNNQLPNENTLDRICGFHVNHA